MRDIRNNPLPCFTCDNQCLGVVPWPAPLAGFPAVDVIDHSISLFDRNPAVDLGGSGREHGKLHLGHIILLSNDRTPRQLLFGLFQISSWTKIPRVEIRSFEIDQRTSSLDPVALADNQLKPRPEIAN